MLAQNKEHNYKVHILTLYACAYATNQPQPIKMSYNISHLI